MALHAECPRDIRLSNDMQLTGCQRFSTKPEETSRVSRPERGAGAGALRAGHPAVPARGSRPRPFPPAHTAPPGRGRDRLLGTPPPCGPGRAGPAPRRSAVVAAATGRPGGWVWGRGGRARRRFEPWAVLRGRPAVLGRRPRGDRAGPRPPLGTRCSGQEGPARPALQRSWGKKTPFNPPLTTALSSAPVTRCSSQA